MDYKPNVYVISMEIYELDKKIEKLTEFICSENFLHDITLEERHMLFDQCYHMKQYSADLAHRLDYYRRES